MDCIINGVTLQYCNSENNILFVDSYKEIFFEIYNVEIGANSFVAELVNVTPKGPIVKVGNLTFGDKVYKDIEFLLLKETAEIRAHVNESNVTAKQFTVKQSILNETKTEDVEQFITEKIVPEVKIDTNILYQVQKLKEDAIANIEKEKQKLQLVKEQVESENQKIESKLEEYKSNLLEHFYQVIEDGSNSITKTTEAKLQILFDNLKQINEEHFKTESKSLIQEHIDNITSLIDSEKNKLNDQLNNSFTKAVTELSETLEDKINISFNDITTKQQKDLQKINDSFSIEFNKATVSLNGLLDNYKLELLNSFYEKIKEATESFDIKSTSVIKETLQKIQDVNKDNFNVQSDKVIKETITVITSDIENAKIKFNREMQNELNSTKEDLSKKILTSFQSETDKISLKIEEIDKAKTEINKELKVLFDNLKQHLVESFNKNEKKFDANIDELSSLKEKYNTELSNLLVDVKGSVQKTFVKEKELIETKLLELELIQKSVDFELSKFTSTIEDKFIAGNKDIKTNVNELFQSLTLENKSAIEDALLKTKEKIEQKLNEISLESVYERFIKEHGPKVDTLINEFIENQKEQGAVPQKFDFFNDKPTVQKFEELIDKHLTVKEPQMITKIKRLIMDFYYMYGSGGGSGNLTIQQVISTGGGGGGPTPYYVFNTSGLTGMSAVLDYFPLSAFNAAKYNIEVLSGNEVYSSEISVLGNNTVARYTEYAVLFTTQFPFINYAVRTTGTDLQLVIKADTDLLNMIIKGVRLDPLSQ